MHMPCLGSRAVWRSTREGLATPHRTTTHRRSPQHHIGGVVAGASNLAERSEAGTWRHKYTWRWMWKPRGTREQGDNEYTALGAEPLLKAAQPRMQGLPERARNVQGVKQCGAASRRLVGAPGSGLTSNGPRGGVCGGLGPGSLQTAQRQKLKDSVLNSFSGWRLRTGGHENTCNALWRMVSNQRYSNYACGDDM